MAAGASWGNAGWLMAGDVTPLPSPETLRDGLHGLLSTTSALRIPLWGRPERYWFLLQLARSCTDARWETSLRALQPLSKHALAAYDDLTSGGVRASTFASRHHLAAFTSVDERDAYARHLEHMKLVGAPTEFDVMDAQQVHGASPILSDTIVGAVGLRGQRYLDASEFVPALAESVRERGGRVVTGSSVRAVRDTGRSAELLVLTESRPRGDPTRCCGPLYRCAAAGAGQPVRGADAAGRRTRLQLQRRCRDRCQGRPLPAIRAPGRHSVAGPTAHGGNDGVRRSLARPSTVVVSTRCARRRVPCFATSTSTMFATSGLEPVRSPPTVDHLLVPPRPNGSGWSEGTRWKAWCSAR